MMDLERVNMRLVGVTVVVYLFQARLLLLRQKSRSIQVRCGGFHCARVSGQYRSTDISSLEKLSLIWSVRWLYQFPRALSLHSPIGAWLSLRTYFETDTLMGLHPERE